MHDQRSSKDERVTALLPVALATRREGYQIRHLNTLLLVRLILMTYFESPKSIKSREVKRTTPQFGNLDSDDELDNFQPHGYPSPTRILIHECCFPPTYGVSVEFPSSLAPSFLGSQTISLTCCDACSPADVALM
jgi:hypothetical protein